jgi:flagellar hook-length control protein FliK
VERGVVSARRERILAQRAESGSQVQAREVKTTDEKIAADRPPQAQPKGHSRFPESDRPRSVDLAESSVRPAAEALKSDAKPSAPEPGAIKASALPAAESAPAARVVADAIRGPTPAEALGRVLAGRPAESVGRVAAASPATAGGEAGQRQAGTASRTAERSAPNKNSESAERGDSARRADFARLVRSLKVQAGAKSSSAVIRLDPPELGRVRINVRMEENALSVRVEAATAKGRELLQSRIRELVDSLAEHNIRVDRLEVVAAEDGSGLSGSHGNPSGSAPMEGMGANANREDRRSDRREGEESVETLEDETLAAALDSRLDIRV